MHIEARSLWLPKRGNSEDEYEDAAWTDAAGDAGPMRVAVADGATEASFSRQWARVLVRAFGRGRLDAPTIVGDVTRLRASWQRAMAGRTGARKLPWYAEQKAELGAFAALVGLELHPAPDAPAHVLAAGDEAAAADPATAAEPSAPHWRAMAVGDSNLFLVRRGALELAFPLVRAEQFSGGPFLIGSTADDPADALRRRVHTVAGELLPGDTFWLMSDALACWFLRRHEQGELPWRALALLFDGDEPEQRFARLVAELRDERLLQNDDVTLVRVACEPAVAPGEPGPGTYWIEADETTPF
ncbi:MAG: hypothetical protein AB7O97_16445 [Planctomycetota bacterium]